MKISPKPARIAPNEPVRPRAISQSSAPIPSIGIAADEILNRRPKSATSQIVEVVPSVAPTIIPVASANVTRPALTKPMTVRMAAVEDWITAVKSAPAATALNRPATRRWSVRRSESPASPLMPSVRWWMPRRKRPSPPRIVTVVLVTASLLGLELLARRRELLLLGGVDGGIGEVEALDRLHDRGGDDQPGEPLVVGRHHEPRRALGCGRPDRLLVRVHVVLPEPALAHVGRGELPVLVWPIEPLHEPLALLLPRDVEEELEDDGSLPGQVVLEVRDVGQPLVPDALRHELRGEPLPVQDLLVDAHHEDLLVVGAVEDADPAALGEAPHVSPHEVVVELLRGGLLEGEHLAALRIDARHHVLDGAVLAGRVHGLEDEQHGPAVLCVEHGLLLGEPGCAALEELGRLLLVQLLAERVARVDVLQPEALALGDAERVDELLDAIEDLLSRHRRLPRGTVHRAPPGVKLGGGLVASQPPLRQFAGGPSDALEVPNGGSSQREWSASRSVHMDAAVSAGGHGDAVAWHALAVNDGVSRLATVTGRGRTADEAASRVRQYGPNRLPAGKRRGPLMRFLTQFNNVLVYVLLGAGFVKLMLNLWLDSAIIMAVVILNALLGFIQEGRAEQALDSIRNMLSPEARALRDGETRMIAAEELVPGDVVLLESGDRVPADLRLTDVKNLRTEEAALTGESVPADKGTDPVSAGATVGDRESMAFSGTMVVSGRATGVIVATGSETELGRINRLLASVSALETPLLRQIKQFGYAITAVIGIVSVVVVAYGKWVRGMPFVELFQAVVGIAVSVIPEGLPALITITLAIGVQRMAQRRAIIRRLPAVETLGSVSRICSDKTGTLTLMEMMVVSAVTAESAYQVSGEGYAPGGEVRTDGQAAGKDRVLELLGRVSLLCNDDELFQQDGVWKVEGDPTEGAQYQFASKIGMERQAEQAAYPRVDAIPFESEHRFMATLHDTPDGGQIFLVKGAPEVILEHCDRQQTAGGPQPPMDREHFLQASDRLAGQGERVLAFAWLENPGVRAGSLGPADLPKNLVLLGLIGLLDPPRKEAIDAVAECQGGHIRVTMITGDHKKTAAAIAKMLGIGDGTTALTGAEIEEMDAATLQEQVRDVDVFARASPEHKLRLVKADRKST